MQDERDIIAKLIDDWQIKVEQLEKISPRPDYLIKRLKQEIDIYQGLHAYDAPLLFYREILRLRSK